MSQTCFLLLFLCCGIAAISGCAALNQGDEATRAPGSPSPAWAALQSALRQRKLLGPDGTFARGLRVVAGEVGKSRAVARCIEEQNLSVGEAAESLLIRRLVARDGETTLLIVGRDARGLAYALWEVADAIACAPPGVDPLSAVRDADESPRLAVRSVSTHLFNADLERDWYFSEAYWHAYFSMLARSRFNNFILTFADQTNYLAPPFPWLFDVPGFDVAVQGLSPQEQQKNLAMLRRIGELAVEYDIRFSLAIWQQQPVLGAGLPEAPYVHNYGKSPLKNLPRDVALTRYNNLALAHLLAQVPTITGLQLRLNYESGIPEHLQHDYYQSLFTTIKNAGRPIALELRYKSLARETIEQALNAGLDVTVSTKFWCEHMGLPFHPTTQDALYSASRYGYGTMLKHPRKYRASYQLWNQGSNRIFLWGDPTYAARLAVSCAEGEGEGMEVFAPLTNKGWGNEPGNWRVLARPELESDAWEISRYWPFFTALGRYTYNPSTSDSVWDRQFVARYGEAGIDIARAVRVASGILPFITATTMTSPSEWGYWPEVETLGSLDQYGVTPPGDYGQFYAVKSFAPVSGWTSGNWTRERNGFVEDAMAGDVEGKWTPVQVSAHLERLAEDAVRALDAAKSRITPTIEKSLAAEFRATEVDVRALALLARFHASKKRAATHLAFFRATGETGRLAKVLQHATESASHWAALAKLTDGFYSDNLVFGRASWLTGGPGKRVNAHEGHWKDRLFDANADVAFATELLAKSGPAGESYKTYPGEAPLEHPPVIEHVPIEHAARAQPLTLTARITGPLPLKQVLLRYRAMDQTKPWIPVKMSDRGEGLYQGVIPASAVTGEYPLLYYLEARVEGGGTLWPNWQQRTPYVVVRVER